MKVRGVHRKDAALPRIGQKGDLPQAKGCCKTGPQGLPVGTAPDTVCYKLLQRLPQFMENSCLGSRRSTANRHGSQAGQDEASTFSVRSRRVALVGCRESDRSTRVCVASLQRMSF